MSKIYAACLALAAASAVAVGCNGTETTNPEGSTTHFDASPCHGAKQDASAQANTVTQALVDASTYDGLKCIEWERTSTDVMTFRLLNFEEGCGVTWDGRSEFGPDGTLGLVLENTDCAVAACGWCIYDYQFDVKLAKSVSGLPLRIGFVDCKKEGVVHWDYEASLPSDAGDKGIVCRYANWSALEWKMSSEACGSAYMPCGETRCPSDCAAGGSCVQVGTLATESVCLSPCTSDADCSPAGVATCQEGSCRVTAGW